MRFRAIEVRPGELLVDEVTVEEAVSRIAGIATVEAPLLFTSRMTLDLFMEGYLPEGEAVEVRFPVIGAGSLLRVIESVSLDVRYVALDPDTPRRQVWAIERFGAHLEDILGPA